MNDNYDLSNLRKKPKRKNSRTKGNTFERQIAKALNDRFDTTEFSRSPGSGAFATTHSLPDHLKIYGDLITPQKFKFCIECKKGYNNMYSEQVSIHLKMNEKKLINSLKNLKCNKCGLIYKESWFTPIKPNSEVVLMPFMVGG